MSLAVAAVSLLACSDMHSLTNSYIYIILAHVQTFLISFKNEKRERELSCYVKFSWPYFHKCVQFNIPLLNMPPSFFGGNLIFLILRDGFVRHVSAIMLAHLIPFLLFKASGHLLSGICIQEKLQNHLHCSSLLCGHSFWSSRTPTQHLGGMCDGPK